MHHEGHEENPITSCSSWQIEKTPKLDGSILLRPKHFALIKCNYLAQTSQKR